jgi:serine acetyltransferase
MLRLIISDYLAYYVRYNPKQDSPRRLALLFMPRLVHNPCLRAPLLIRLALASPRFLLGLWRTVLITLHSIDIQPAVKVGPGFTMPHPFGVVLGWGVELGTNVSILHNVTLGATLESPEGKSRLCPVIEDDVTIFAGSFLLGPITVGRGAVVGAGSWVTNDVPARAVHRGVGAEVQQQPGHRSLAGSTQPGVRD